MSDFHFHRTLSFHNLIGETIVRGDRTIKERFRSSANLRQAHCRGLRHLGMMAVYFRYTTFLKFIQIDSR